MALTPFNLNQANMDDQIAVHNIDDQGNITGQTGLSRVVANYGNISDFDSFSPELQAAIQGYQNPPPKNYMSDLLQQPPMQGDVPSNSFGQFGNMGGAIAAPGFPGFGGQEPVYSVGNTMPDFNTGTAQLPGPIAGITNMDIATTGNGIFNPIAPMPSPVTPPPGMSSGHSHDDLLSGIGKLFEQYFPNQGQTSQSNLGQPNFSNNHSYTQPFNGPGILGLITPQRS